MFKAIIFDFDGVIADTEPIHMEAWLSVLERYGISFEQDEYNAHYIGLNDRDFLNSLSHIHRHHFDDTEKSSLIEEKTSVVFNMLKQGIPLLPGVEQFVKLSAKNKLLAICSGANRSELEFMLKQLKWENIFNPIIASDAVKKGKPDPEGYIRALEGLIERSDGKPILPEEVLAIEDSPKGIAAAHKAGLKCLAISNSFDVNELKAADWVATSLADVNLKKLV